MYNSFSTVITSLVLVTTFLFSGTNLVAQNYVIRGTVIDQEKGDPIEYATVVLTNALDSTLIGGVVTDALGDFEMKEKLTAPTTIAVQFMGYTAYNAPLVLTKKNINLGNISLGISGATLETIEVAGKAITSLHQLDKQVYAAEQFQNAQGGTAADVLKSLPSVTMNAFGEISVRGTTGFLVMVNGKPSQADPATILAQLPANAIQDIEIITAPSAKYDPDGKAGIVNIKTKQGVTDGLVLIANAMVGLPSIEPYNNKRTAKRYGVDVTINYKKDKWDIAAGLDYRRADLSGRRVGYVNTYLSGVLTEFPSTGERSFDNEIYSGRLSATFNPTTRQSVTAGFYAGKRTKKRTADILYDQQRVGIADNDFLGTEAYYDLFLDNNRTTFSGGTPINTLSYFNKNLRVRRGDFFIGSLDYAIDLSAESRLRLSGLYERTILGGPTDNVSLAFPNTEKVLQLQQNDNDNPLDGFRIQADYSQKLGAAKWESGYSYRHLKHPGDFEYLDRDLDNNVWVPNPLFTNRIELRRSIHAVYSQISGKQNKWEYTAGLRLEYFDRQVDILRPDSTYQLDQLNLFPSVNLGYNATEDLTFKFGYSRRIERTTTFKMTPFPEREHSETLEQGDAELLPEYIDLVEAGLVQNWGDHSFFATAYYRHIDQVINRVNTVFNDTILNRIYTNVGMARAIGLELGATVYPAKGWRLYLGGNIFNYKIGGSLFDDNINTSNVVYSINANTNYNFSHSFTLQLAFNYLSERITAQGRDSRFFNPSLTLKKTFLDKKLAIALQWQNIDLGLWSANEQRITTVRDNFYTTTNYIYEVDIIQLNFTYQLNQSAKRMKLPESEFGKKEF